MSKYTVGIIVVIFLAFGGLIYISQINRPANSNTISPADMTSRQLVDVCTTDMATQFHVHSHLMIMADKAIVQVPQNIGIDLQKDCMSSVHTHDTSGVIHIEAPVKKDFTLGDFFYKWNKPFSKTQILTHKTDETHGLKIFSDGKEVADPETLIMTDHQNIFIDYYALKDGPDPLPQPFNWEEE